MPASSNASINTDGIPHSPNPPTDSVAPSGCRRPPRPHLPQPCPREDTSAAILPRVVCPRSPQRHPSPRLRSAHACEPRAPAVWASPTPPDWPGVQLHVVTGKGGTGKTTVAAALALALASRGKTVLLCEVEGRQGIAQLFDVAPLPYEERLDRARAPTERRRGLRAGDRRRGGAAGVPRHVLPARPRREGARPVRRDRVRHHHRARRARRAAHRQGLRGRQAQPRATRARRTYDAVVLDAPPTGRIGQFLNVNTELAGLAKVGPIKPRPTPS